MHTLVQSFFSYMIWQSAQIQTFNIQSYSDISTAMTIIINPHKQEYQFMDLVELSSHHQLIQAFPWIRQEHTHQKTVDGEQTLASISGLSSILLLDSYSLWSNSNSPQPFHYSYNIIIPVFLVGFLVSPFCFERFEYDNQFFVTHFFSLFSRW